MTGRPRLSARLLERWLPQEDRDEIIGDLDEQFAERLRRDGARRARRWYRAQARDLVWRYRQRPGSRVTHAAPGGRTAMPIDDLRHVARQFRRRPAAPLLVAAMLAAAIGLCTGTFAVIDSLLLERAPFRESEQLRALRVRYVFGQDNPELDRLVAAWRAAGIFEAVEAAGAAPRETPETGVSGAAALVTPGLFDMLGVRPIRGRGFTDDDTRAGDLEPVVISERLWRESFGADPATLGNVVTLGGRDHRLIGIMPEDFRFPDWDTVIWRPLSLDARPFPFAVGRPAYVRLPHGIPESEVLVRATAIAGAADPRFTARPNELYLSPIGGIVDDNAARALPLFGGGVTLIFLALCANASGILLSRMTVRRRELGLRLSLGASRWRLLRESAIEHAIVAAAGVAAGIGIARVVTSAAPRLMSEGFGLVLSLNPIDVDPRALALAASLGALAVLIAGVLPAWVGTRVDPADAIRPSDRTQTESRSARAIARALLVAQVAFAAMLVLGAGLLVRSFGRMATADRGMDPRGVHTINAFMSSVAPAVLDDAQARLRAIPGVEAAAIAGGAPPVGNNDVTGTWRTDLVSGIAVESELYEVRPDYFDFFGLTLLRGRHFQPGDGQDVAIVSERIAAMLWPNADPLGKVMTMEDGPFSARVIGVARDIALPSLRDGVDLPEIYVPHTGRRKVMSASWKCRARCPERSEIVTAIRTADARAEVIGRISSAEETYAGHLVRPRVAAELGATFAAVGFLTCGAGLFAALTYAVGRRRREFGIRTALGATPAALRRSVTREALAIAAAGVAIGAVGGWLLQRGLSSVTYGVSGLDPAAWLAMMLIVALTMFAASWRPARQAARVDPIELLRQE